MCVCLLGSNAADICVSVSVCVLLVSVVVCLLCEPVCMLMVCLSACKCRTRAHTIMCMSVHMLMEYVCLRVSVGYGHRCCSGLNENGFHRIVHLNAWSPPGRAI